MCKENRNAPWEYKKSLHISVEEMNTFGAVYGIIIAYEIRIKIGSRRIRQLPISFIVYNNSIGYSYNARLFIEMVGLRLIVYTIFAVSLG